MTLTDPNTSTTPEIVRQILLRQPRERRSGSVRHGHAATSLLPVFFAGQENRLAAFICGSLIPNDDPGDAAMTSPDTFAGTGELQTMTPILLIGPPGSGKSTIALHIAALLVDKIFGSTDASDDESHCVLSMPAVDFARWYSRAVDSDDISQLRHEMQTAPVLVIDDVQLMADKVAAQDELAARLEFRQTACLPTILTCRRLPTQIPGLRPLLVSRMLPGLMMPIRLPGPAATREILMGLVQRRPWDLQDSDIDAIHGALPPETPARHLESVVQHLEVWCRMKGCKPSAAAIREAIGSQELSSDVSTDKVAKMVARRYKLKLSELKSGTRRHEVVRARSLAMYLSRQLTTSSYDKIGKYFGGRDHTTVLHACRKTESLIQCDDELRLAANEVSDSLQATG